MEIWQQQQGVRRKSNNFFLFSTYINVEVLYIYIYVYIYTYKKTSTCM